MKSIVPIIMGSERDRDFSEEIALGLDSLGVPYALRVGSADKYPDFVDEHLKEYESGHFDGVVYMLVAGRSNRLGGYVTGRTLKPAVACPPVKSFPLDIWSSLRNASDSPLVTVLGQRNAAAYAASVLALGDDRELMERIRKGKGLKEKRMENFGAKITIGLNKRDDLAVKKYMDLLEKMGNFMVIGRDYNLGDWNDIGSRLEEFDGNSRIVHILLSGLCSHVSREIVERTSNPVIICPTNKNTDELTDDVYRFIEEPIGAGIVLEPGNAAEAAARILSLYDNPYDYEKILAKHRKRLQKDMKKSDERIRKIRV
jgi:5-(carboxyamino)imidazole ribonucleotide mutase